MKKVGLIEEIIYVWDCPYCEEMTEEYEELNSEEEVECKHCGKKCQVE